MAKLNSGIFWEDKIPGSYWKVKAQVILWFMYQTEQLYQILWSHKIFQNLHTKSSAMKSSPVLKYPRIFRIFQRIWVPDLGSLKKKRSTSHGWMVYFKTCYSSHTALDYIDVDKVRMIWWRQWLARKGLSYLGIISWTCNNGGSRGISYLGLTSGGDRYQITEKAKAMVDYSSFFFKHFTFLSWENELFIFPCKKNLYRAKQNFNSTILSPWSPDGSCRLHWDAPAHQGV